LYDVGETIGTGFFWTDIFSNKETRLSLPLILAAEKFERNEKREEVLFKTPI
jgi:hypothetical protein